MSRPTPRGRGYDGRLAAAGNTQNDSFIASPSPGTPARRSRVRAWLPARRSWRLLLGLGVLIAVAASLVPGGGLRPTGAAAAPPVAAGKPIAGVRPVTASGGVKPRTVPSYYIGFTDPGRGYDLGCQQGRADAPLGRVDSTVMLLFGAQNAENTGTRQVRGSAVSYDQIAAISQAFARGYWACTGENDQARLFLSIATNNSGWNTTYAGGVAWGNLVNRIKAHVVSQYNQVVVLGGSDIEPAWGSYEATSSWVNGYTSVAWQQYLNMASAEGCPITSADGGACDNGWTQRDVWWLSYGHPLALAAPQIYYSVNAQQWAMIARYGASQGKPSSYVAATDQYPADPSTLDAGASWGALQGAMNGHPATASTVPFSMEVSYA